MARRPVPVMIVAGHLGSGKTTVVNHLLRHAGGTRIGVVVNDFGAVAVDALLVEGRADAMRSLADGCLCCEVDANGLADLLATLTAPRTGLDLVLVEASGLAEPRELVRMLLAADAPHAVYGGLVVVVDAVEFPAARAARPDLDEHVGIADLVVLNKVDRLAAGPHDVLAIVRGLAAGAVLPVAHGAVDPALLTEPAPAPRSGQLSFGDLLHDGGHAHAAYDSVAFTEHRPLDPARFVAFLEGGPPGVYRAKGFVRFAGDRRTYEVQTVGTSLRFRVAPRRAAVDGASLVLIGAGIDRAELARALEACVAGDTAPTDHAMLPVLRHLVD